MVHNQPWLYCCNCDTASIVATSNEPCHCGKTVTAFFLVEDSSTTTTSLSSGTLESFDVEVVGLLAVFIICSCSCLLPAFFFDYLSSFSCFLLRLLSSFSLSFFFFCDGWKREKVVLVVWWCWWWWWFGTVSTLHNNVSIQFLPVIMHSCWVKRGRQVTFGGATHGRTSSSCELQFYKYCSLLMK